MSGTYDETYAVYNERKVRARKRHTCDACGEPIEPGHRYWRIAGIYSEGVSSWKRCLRCQKIHLHLRSLDPGGYEQLWPDERLSCGEGYRDHWGVDPPPEIAALAFTSAADMQEAEDNVA